MAECERLAKCSFFSNQMVHMPKSADLMKETFCRGEKTLCARYQVAKAGLPVPSDLFPQDLERAREIVHRHESANSSRH
jgi:hypothetical protein